VSGGETGRIRWRVRPGADAAALAPRLAAALEALAAGRVADLRSGRRKRLYRIALGPGGVPDHLLKRNAYPPLRLGSKARRELAIAMRLAERGVPVVLPLAAGERRAGARLRECWLVVPLVEGATDLARHAARGDLAASERRGLAHALGALVRRAHDAGLVHGDLAPNNVLLRPGLPPALWLVDFERARLRACVGSRARRRMLAKLARGLPDASASQRLRFLRAYALGDARAARRWWRALEAEAPRLARRDHRRMRRKTARDGRRIRRVRGPDGAGFAWRGAPAEALAGGWLEADARAADALECAAGVWRLHARVRGARAARELWALAHTLFARGLGPRPLALRVRGRQCLLVLERAPGARRLVQAPRLEAERAAAERLLRRLLCVAEVRAPLRPGEIALVTLPGAGLRALLLAPDAVRFAGRAAGAAGRARARALLAAPAAPG
jgi:hypothetical protein